MKVSPSLLAANFMNLTDDVKRIKDSGCEYIHLDVMDGCFVPNISFGPGIIKQLKEILDVPFDVHLMISNPRFYLNEFKKSGADILTYHYEVNDNHHELIKEIKNLGMQAGLSIKPNTKVEEIVPYLNDLDLVLVRRQSGCPERQPVDFQGNCGVEVSRMGELHRSARPRRGGVREHREGTQA